MLEMMLGSGPAGVVSLKWYAFGVCPVILTMKGNLYVTGNAGRLANEGSNTTVLTNWKLIDTNVEMAGLIGGNGLVWRKSDKTWWMVGYTGYMFGGLDVNVKRNVSTYCTNIPASGEIKFIGGSSGVVSFVLLTNGTVYAGGYNAWLGLGASSPVTVNNFIVMTTLGGVPIAALEAPQENNLYLDFNKNLLLNGYDNYGVSGSAAGPNLPTAKVIKTGIDKFSFGYYSTHALSGTTLFSTGAQPFGQLGDGVLGGNGIANYRTTWYQHPEPVLDIVGRTYGLYARLADGWYFTGMSPRYGETSAPATATFQKMDTTGLLDPVFVRNNSPDLQVAYDRGCFVFRGATNNAKIPGYTNTYQTSWVTLPMTGVE